MCAGSIKLEHWVTKGTSLAGIKGDPHARQRLQVPWLGLLGRLGSSLGQNPAHDQCNIFVGPGCRRPIRVSFGHAASLYSRGEVGRRWQGHGQHKYTL